MSVVVMLRFDDLKKRGIVRNWPQLKRLQQHHAFPLGKMLSPNVRARTEQEIGHWVQTRPVENVRPLQGAPARRRAAAAERAAAAADSDAGSDAIEGDPDKLRTRSQAKSSTDQTTPSSASQEIAVT